MRNFCRLLCVVLLVTAARAYVVDTDPSAIYVTRWDPGSISMQIKMPNTQMLQDGTTLASSVQAAMQAWNGYLGADQFTSQIIDTPANPPAGTYSTSNTDTHNEIVMDSTFDGMSFDSQTLAITTNFSSGNSFVQSDMVFNTAWTWNSYRGNLQGTLIDIRRVAIHELGHVLGLDHPDNPKQWPSPALPIPSQSVVAIMNSRISNIDTMQADDIAGVQLLYGSPGFIPANDDFANAASINLSSSSIQLTGTNVKASRQTGEPIHAGADAPGHSVWWKWTAPSSASTTIDTLGSNFDTVLAVYTGSSVSALALVASNDDAEAAIQGVSNPVRKRTSTVTFNAVAGTTYRIAVDGWGSISQGDQSTYTGAITLNLAFAGSLGTNTVPAFTTQPVSQTVNAGAPVTFSAAANGSPAPSYQWRKNGANISGATSNTYSIGSCAAPDAGTYSVVATNVAGSATSAGAALAVIVSPSNAIISITVQ